MKQGAEHVAIKYRRAIGGNCQLTVIVLTARDCPCSKQRVQNLLPFTNTGTFDINTTQVNGTHTHTQKKHIYTTKVTLVL